MPRPRAYANANLSGKPRGGVPCFGLPQRKEVCFRDICRDGSRPIRTSGRAQRIKSRRMARGFIVALCFGQGSTERSRPFPTKQPKGRNHPVRFFDSLSEPPLMQGRFVFCFFSCCRCAVCGRSGPGRCPAAPKGRAFPAFRPRRPARRSG